MFPEHNSAKLKLLFYILSFCYFVNLSFQTRKYYTASTYRNVYERSRREKMDLEVRRLAWYIYRRAAEMLEVWLAVYVCEATKEPKLRAR